MKRTTFTLFAIIVAMVTWAQPQLSGKYKIDRSQSQLQQEFSMAPNEVSIQATKDEFIVEKLVSFQGNDFTISDKYTLDGKECINPGWMDTKKKSTAVWDKKEKKLTVTSKVPMQDNEEMTIVEVYRQEGNKLIIESKATSSFGEMKETMIFSKN